MRRPLLFVSLATAPLLVGFGEIVSGEHPLSPGGAAAEVGRWQLGHVLLAVGTALMVPAALALRLISVRNACLAVTGLGCVVAGVVASSTIFGVDFLAAEMAGTGSPDEMRVILQQALNEMPLRAVDTLQFLLPLGIVVLAGSVAWSRRDARTPFVLVAAAIVLVAGPLPDGLVLLGRVLLVVGLAWFGTFVLRSPDPPTKPTEEASDVAQPSILSDRQLH